MKHIVRSAYGKKTGVGIKFTDVSLTKQSFTKECDINNILKKYQKTGAIDHVNKHEASYGYASSDDFTASMAIVAKGETMFNDLPSSIRNKFENDPAQFLDFVQDEKNIKEMQELGLATKNDKTTTEPEPIIPAEKSAAIISEADAKKAESKSDSQPKA